MEEKRNRASKLEMEQRGLGCGQGSCRPSNTNGNERKQWGRPVRLVCTVQWGGSYVTGQMQNIAIPSDHHFNLSSSLSSTTQHNTTEHSLILRLMSSHMISLWSLRIIWSNTLILSSPYVLIYFMTAQRCEVTIHKKAEYLWFIWTCLLPSFATL